MIPISSNGMCVINTSCTELSEWCGVLIAPMQDGKEEDIRDITADMLHGQVDVLYVLFRCDV